MNKKKIEKTAYQTDFSRIYYNPQYEASRRKKAKKIFSIIRDYWKNEDLSGKTVLEIGCYKGEISIELSRFFKYYHAIDIDVNAIQIAKSKIENSYKNLRVHIMNAESLLFDDNSFDIVLCSHVYEHVPTPKKMMDEIYRVLKQRGICYLAAGNKYNIIEPHYHLPFLSFLPKKVANIYLKIFRGKKHYYETHYSVFALRKLVQKFEIIDYTKIIMREPNTFHLDDMVKNNSLKQLFGIWLLRICYCLSPTYIWILKKKC